MQWGGHTEEVTSRKNPLVVHFRKLMADRGYRYGCGEYLCQGKKLYEEALKFKAPIITVMYSGDRPEIPDWASCVRTTKGVLDSISTMDSAPDIIFSCRIPEADNNIPEGRHIVLEDLQDPGNVGTIIRTANAFMMDSVILTGSSADPYNPKAVRASMGAVFRQRIYQMPQDTLISSLKQANIPLYATGLDENCLALNEMPKSRSAAIAIGNEGKGLSAEMFSASVKRLMIPMNPDCESLNAAIAAAVIMWELYK